MARGQPDFGAYQQKTVGGTLADLGEAVGRLGSIVTYDRRGDVVDLDDFEGPDLKGAITPGRVYHDSTHTISGSQAVRMDTLAFAGSNAMIRKSLSSFGSKRQGSEIHVSNPTLAAHFEHYMDQYDGTWQIFGEVEIYFNTGVVRVADQALGWVVIATVPGFTGLPDLFYPTKLVVDFSTRKYVRLLLQDTEYDLSAYSMSRNLSGVAPHTRCQMTYEADAAVASSIWLSNFIFTIDEP